MSGKLSTHALDNHAGKPAANLAWTLKRFDPSSDSWLLLASGKTNQDGRNEGPLLLGDELVTGRYQLSFQVADYYREQGVPISEPAFLDVVSLEANLIAGEAYHLPILMTPWSYSTYRGS